MGFTPCVSLAADGCVDLSADGVEKASQTTNQFRCPLTKKELWEGRFLTATSKKFRSRTAPTAPNSRACKSLNARQVAEEKLERFPNAWAGARPGPRTFANVRT